jgi:hypothetical protein
MKKIPEEWLKTKEFKGYIILDWDGWDRTNMIVELNTPITKKEMWNKLMRSTIRKV